MPNKHGARSIHTAAREGHANVVNSLIKKGEKVDALSGEVESEHRDTLLLHFLI